MSIKIYNAYRIKTNQLTSFTMAYDEICKRQIKQYLSKIIDGIDWSKFVHWYVGDKTSQDDIIWEIIRWIHEVAIKPASMSKRQSIYNLNYGYSAIPDGHFIYIIPDTPTFIFYNLINLDEMSNYAQDYSYWDNSDKPDNISKKGWNKRGKKWESLFDLTRLYWSGLDTTQFFDFAELFLSVVQEN